MFAMSLFLVLTILAASQASPIQLVPRTIRLPSSTDPFYQPPPSYSDLPPGTILRHRIVDPPPTINASISVAHQVLYRSTDSQNIPNAVVTTVLIPASAQHGKLFSFQLAYDSPFVDCSPSYELYTNDTHSEVPLIAAALNEGWAVSYPDYEGPTAAFTNGIQSGQAVLDSLRALLSSSDMTGLGPDTTYTLAGASGGSLASLWALELLPSYAPELNVSGALLTATVPNIISALRTIDGTIYAGLIPSGLLGLAKQYPVISEWLSVHLRSNVSEMFVEVGQRCIDENLVVYANHSFSDFFNVDGAWEEGVQDYTFDPLLGGVAREASDSGYRGTPSTPMFIFKGVLDELSPVADTDELVNKYCEVGAGKISIEYQRALNADHSAGGMVGFTAGWGWLRNRMNGVVVEGGCTVSNVTLRAQEDV